MPENNPEGYNFPQESGRTATQRGSLKQVNATLLAQTEVLRDTQKSIFATNNLLTKSLQNQLKTASMAKLENLEKEREGGRFKAVAGGIGAIGSKIGGAAQSGASSLQGMLGKIGSFLTPAALAALPGILAGTLLKRGIPALAVGLFADEIAEFLLGPDAEQEMKDQVARTIQGGAIGSLLGKRFALIGAAAGFLIDDEVAAQLKELGVSFASLFSADIKNLDDLKDVMTSIGNFLRDNLKVGLEGIDNLLNLEIGKFFGIGDGESQVASTLGLIAALGLVFAPGKTLRLALALPGILMWTGGKVVKAIRLLAGLGTAVNAAGIASAGASATGLAARGLGFTGVLGRMFAFTPAGAITLVAGAGFAFTEWFKTTELGKELMRMGEEASQKLNEDVEGMGPRELNETSVTQSELGNNLTAADTQKSIDTEIARIDNILGQDPYQIGQGLIPELSESERKALIQRRATAEQLRTVLPAGAKVDERSDLAMILKYYKGAQKLNEDTGGYGQFSRRSSAMAVDTTLSAQGTTSKRNEAPVMLNNVDNSSTVNAPNNTAISIPLTSSSQYDAYEAWLASRGSRPAFPRL